MHPELFGTLDCLTAFMQKPAIVYNCAAEFGSLNSKSNLNPFDFIPMIFLSWLEGACTLHFCLLCTWKSPSFRKWSVEIGTSLRKMAIEIISQYLKEEIRNSNYFFASENMKEKHPQFFFSIAFRPRTNPN